MQRLLYALVLAPLVACSTETQPDDVPVEPEPTPLAAGVRIERVGLYQGIEVELVPAVSTVPAVSGRDAWMRVFVSFEPGAAAVPLRAQLWIDGVVAAEASGTFSSASSQQSWSSTLNLAVPVLGVSPTWHVEVLADGGAVDVGNSAARTPTATLLTATATPLKVMLLPLVYEADGSGRRPDLSPEQIEMYRQRLLALYPVPSVDIEVGADVDMNTVIDADGDGWDPALDMLFSLRRNLGVADDVYVYALVAPSSSFDAYCTGGCVEGVSFFDEHDDPDLRVGLGLGFTGERSAMTMAHEIGHAHGRDHAPCNVYDADPNFPHADGAIGVWGFDAFQQLLYPPSTADVMSYCEPAWISDYNYLGLLDRHQSMLSRSWRPLRAHHIFRVHRDGRVEPLGEQMMAPLRSPTTTVNGIEGHLLRHAHGGPSLLARPVTD